MRAVVHPAPVLTPRALLGVADLVRASDVVVVTDFRQTHGGEELLSTVRVDATRQAVGRAVVNPVHRVAGVPIVPGDGFITDRARVAGYVSLIRPAFSRSGAPLVTMAAG